MITMVKPYLYGALALLLLGAMAFSYSKGEASGKAEVQVKFDALNLKLEVAHARELEVIAKQEENQIEIANEISNSVDRINAHYQRLLLQAKNNPRSIPVTSCSEATDGATAKHQAIELERDCALDANHVIMWQGWAIKNKIPISE